MTGPSRAYCSWLTLVVVVAILAMPVTGSAQVSTPRPGLSDITYTSELTGRDVAWSGSWDVEESRTGVFGRTEFVSVQNGPGWFGVTWVPGELDAGAFLDASSLSLTLDSHSLDSAVIYREPIDRIPFGDDGLAHSSVALLVDGSVLGVYQEAIPVDGGKWWQIAGVAAPIEEFGDVATEVIATTRIDRNPLFGGGDTEDPSGIADTLRAGYARFADLLPSPYDSTALVDEHTLHVPEYERTVTWSADWILPSFGVATGSNDVVDSLRLANTPPAGANARVFIDVYAPAADKPIDTASLIQSTNDAYEGLTLGGFTILLSSDDRLAVVLSGDVAGVPAIFYLERIPAQDGDGRVTLSVMTFVDVPDGSLEAMIDLLESGVEIDGEPVGFAWSAAEIRDALEDTASVRVGMDSRQEHDVLATAS